MRIKKLFTGLMIVALAGFLTLPMAFAKDRVNWEVDHLTVNKSAKIQGLLQAVANTTGDVYYVNSAIGANASGVAGSFQRPFDTLDYAIGRTTANNNDVIIVMPGHAESYTAANGFDADVAGITIIGLGTGTDMPEFTFADTDATVAIGAANVTIANLRFIAGISNIVVGISVETGGDNFTMIDCEVPESGTATFDFATFIDLASGADNITIDGMIFRQLATTPGDLDHFLKSGTGVNKNLTVKNSDIRGEFLVAAIWSDQIDTNVLIDNSVIVNATNGQHAIEFTTTAAGLIRNTAVSTDAQATAIDPGSLDLVNVKWNSDTTPDVSGIDAIATALGASGPDSIGGINATTTDSLHGKIGTDTEMADSSLFDMLTAIDDYVDTEVAAIAADTAQIADSTLPAAPAVGSLARFIASGGTALGTPLPDSKSLYDITGAYTADGGADDEDTIMAHLDLVYGDTQYIADLALPAAPVANSLAAFIASGGTGLGTELADSRSLVDVLGSDGTTTTGATAGSLLGAIGTNEAAADTPFSSATVEYDKDGSALERLESLQKAQNPLYNSTNYLTASIDFSSATWNTVASHEVFTVTGTVRVRILAVCSESLLETDPQAANGTIQLGIAGTTDAFIAATAQTAVDAGEIWHDATPDASTEAFSVVKDFIVANGADIGYELAVEATTDGTIDFHVWWEPLDATGAVVAGDGSGL